MLKINSKLLLLIIIILSAALRLWNLGSVPVSLFGDELDLGYHAYSIAKTGKDYQGNFMPIHFHSLAEWRTPLYIYSAVPSVAIFGITPFGVRLPAVIFGILSIWGTYLLANEFVKKKFGVWNLDFGVLPAILLSLSPWHIHYSRAGFEVTMLLAFLIFGLYFFFRALREKGNLLWLAFILLTFTPWIYSTAKLFTPLLIVFIFLVWKNEILKLPKRSLIRTLVAGLVVGLPIVYSTIFGGGAERAKYTSVFTDPTVEPEVGISRDRDASMKGNLVVGHVPDFGERLYHNKLVFWYKNISTNYFQSLSTDFLFNEGDPNIRHSPKGIGQFYHVEIVGLLLGLILFFGSSVDFKIKKLIAFWILVGILPSALTRDGGYHATRLILMLPPLTFLIAYGLAQTFVLLGRLGKSIFIILYFVIFTFNFTFYLHNYYFHYPWDSERWWHAGFKESVQSIKAIDESYDKVFISMAGEPAWIFFAAWYEYPPDLWQKNFPIGNDKEISGFGKVSYIDKYYFGKFTEGGGNIYNLGKYIDEKTLYLATSSEVAINLILEPGRTPPDLNLIKSIAYPSGEPAYYLFSKKK